MAGMFVDPGIEQWNISIGCAHVTDECAHCNAEKLVNRLATNPKTPKYHGGFQKVKTFGDALLEPSNWKDPRQVWVSPLSDLFHHDVPDAFIEKAFGAMGDTPHHIYYVLTKRPERLKALPDLSWHDNIAVGVSVGTQKATARIADLQACGAKHKFVVFEPLLEEISNVDLTGLTFVMVGGERGVEARLMQKQWAEAIQQQCNQQKVPFLFKGWGNSAANPDADDPTLTRLHRYYTKGGCMLNGQLYLDNPLNPNDNLPTLDLFGKEYLIMDEAYGLTTIWELKSYLPVMDKDLMAKLRDDIRKNGMHDPILFARLSGVNLVLEGHTRLMVAMDLGLDEIPAKEVTEPFETLEEVQLWMVRHQFQRRNLSAVEKIELAWLSKETLEQQARANIAKAGKQEEVEQNIDTHAEIARLAGVGRSTVVRYGAVMNSAPRTVQEKMRTGELSIAAAYGKLKQPSPTPEPGTDPDATTTNKPEKTHPEPRLVQSHEEGLNLLNNNDIYGLITLPHNTVLEFFSKKQLQRFGFLILNPQNKL
jgi:protein gp37/ParB-like chromosome segregation protein Spo0J